MPPLSPAATPAATDLAAIARIDHDDVDTFLHVGGALGITGMIQQLEQTLGRPIVAVNAATYWYALRRHGIVDPLIGFGTLAQEAAIGT